jgi:hypothetical protein
MWVKPPLAIIMCVFPIISAVSIRSPQASSLCLLHRRALEISMFKEREREIEGQGLWREKKDRVLGF